MSMHGTRTSLALAAILLGAAVLPSAAQEPTDEQVNLPTVKFFYFDSAAVEWAVSAEPERFQRHLSSNAESRALFDAVSAAIKGQSQANDSSAQMTRWIENERTRFERTRRDAGRVRMAEAVVAYLRSADFGIQSLVADLKRRSGASDVELVVVHLRDRQANPQFKLKVVLVDPTIAVGKEGFNIDLQSPNASYTVVAYALGVAVYEVQEIIHGGTPDAPKEDSPAVESPAVETLPAPPEVPPP